jgi:HEAT repeat protein
MQRDRYPGAATRGDGDALRTRITAALARRGDAESAQEIAEVAEAAAAPAVPSVPVAAAAPASPRPGRAPKPARAPRPSRHDECDNEDDTKAIALNALLQMDAERAVPILEKVLARRDSASTCLRRRAMFLISQKQTGRTEDILLNAARTDPDAEVRQQAVFWLSQVNSDKAIAALESVLSRADDPEMQEKALFALSQQQSPRASAILRAFAERESAPAELRGRAIFWMGQKGGDNSAYLRTLYGKVRDAELREQILFSVSQAGGQANGDWLLGIAKNGQEPMELRKRALFWAGQGSASIGELVRLYDGITDREMREQLVFVYSQRNEREAMDKMIDIARRDPDQEIRKRALFWISQSKDPRATQLIQDILED